MKERPILFSGPMVRAILDGRKTQTRRIVKGPIDFLGGGGKDGPDWNDPSCWGWADEYGDYHTLAPDGQSSCDLSCCIACPFGTVGDRLWVRETWIQMDRQPTIKHANGVSEIIGYLPGGVGYRADYRHGQVPITEDGQTVYRTVRDNWRPSIHMPRKFARILLEITDVRVERLKDISEEAAIAEGCFFTDYGRRCLHQGQGDTATCPAPPEHHLQRNGWMWAPTDSSDQCFGSARFAFGNLWSSVYGHGAWDANPWVWAVTFKKL